MRFGPAFLPRRARRLTRMGTAERPRIGVHTPRRIPPVSSRAASLRSLPSCRSIAPSRAPKSRRLAPDPKAGRTRLHQKCAEAAEATSTGRKRPTGSPCSSSTTHIRRQRVQVRRGAHGSRATTPLPLCTRHGERRADARGIAARRGPKPTSVDHRCCTNRSRCTVEHVCPTEPACNPPAQTPKSQSAGNRRHSASTAAARSRYEETADWVKLESEASSEPPRHQAPTTAEAAPRDATPPR